MAFFNAINFFFQIVQADLSSFVDSAESNLRFLAMLAGPFYPILNLGNERHVPP